LHSINNLAVANFQFHQKFQPQNPLIIHHIPKS
jgi:hypothetical protein